MEDLILKEIFTHAPIKLETYRRAPHQGPKILFFSGGTALCEVSRELTRYTHNSIHILTPFDSGGSTGEIRKYFGIPAVGDIRSRLMALSSASPREKRAISNLFTHRFSGEGTHEEALSALESLADGSHPLMAPLPGPVGHTLRSHFRKFLEAMPAEFDLRGACMGNLLITAEYLTSQRRMGPVIDLFSRLTRVHGVIRPVVAHSMHLAAELEDGSVVVGQHLLTGKEVRPIQSKIRRIWLTDSLNGTNPVKAAIDRETAECIGQAELICYPFGSFYTSIVANLLPEGVGKAVSGNPCPKVFVPNPFQDPELLGHSVEEQVTVLRNHLLTSGAPRAQETLDYVLVDTQRGDYPGGLDTPAIEKMGVEVIDTTLITDAAGQCIDKKLLTRALLSLT